MKLTSGWGSWPAAKSPCTRAMKEKRSIVFSLGPHWVPHTGLLGAFSASQITTAQREKTISVRIGNSRSQGTWLLWGHKAQGPSKSIGPRWVFTKKKSKELVLYYTKLIFWDDYWDDYSNCNSDYFRILRWLFGWLFQILNLKIFKRWLFGKLRWLFEMIISETWHF